jgi:hypothetical protein
MALWKARSLSSEFKVQIAEEQSQNKTLESEDSGIFVGVEDSKSLQMSEVFSSTISANVIQLTCTGHVNFHLHLNWTCKFCNYL